MNAKPTYHPAATRIRFVWRHFNFGAVIWTLIVSGANAQPAASPVNSATCIDLSKRFTAYLTNSLNSPSFVLENNLASLPSGRQVFLGTAFEVGGLLQLSGKKLLEWDRKEFPEAINAVKVEKRCRRILLLHGAGGVFDRDGVTIAKLVLHYADKSQREFEIQNGVHVRDWWG